MSKQPNDIEPLREIFTSKPMEALISAAHGVVEDLLRTEITAFDVATALETHCSGWDEVDRDAALRLAVEFAQVRGMALLMAKEVESPELTMARMEANLWVGYELGEHLDLPVDVVWDDEMREQSFLRRSQFPIPPGQ